MMPEVAVLQDLPRLPKMTHVSHKDSNYWVNLRLFDGGPVA